MNPEISKEQLPDFKDRKGWLIFFGIVQILTGFCLLFFVTINLLIFTFSSHLFIDEGLSYKSSAVFISSLSYISLGGLAIFLGFGSIFTRRWARALTLIFSWYALFIGVFSLLFLFFLFPSMLDQLPGENEIDRSAFSAIMIIMSLILVIPYIVLPTVFILFYRSKNVKMTCEKRDPKRRWTDRCPMPILGLAVGMLWLSIFQLGVLFYGAVFPIFGLIISGIPGMILYIGFSFFWLWLAWNIYKQKLFAVKTLLFTTLFLLSSAVVTFSQIGFWGLMSHYNFSEKELELIKNLPLFQGNSFIYLMFVPALIWIGYIFYVWSVFPRPANDPDLRG